MSANQRRHARDLTEADYASMSLEEMLTTPWSSSGQTIREWYSGLPAGALTPAEPNPAPPSGPSERRT